MKRARLFLINSIIITCGSLLIQGIDVWFRLYITNNLGVGVIGINQLITSVYSLFITLAVSGVNLASTRTISEEIGKGNSKNIKTAVYSSIVYSLLFGLLSMLLLYCISDIAGNLWLKTPGSPKILKTFSFSLPFISLASSLGGYFLAVKKSHKSVIVQIFEQTSKIAVVIIMLFFKPPQNDIDSCMYIALASVIADIASALLALILFKIDIGKYKNSFISNVFYKLIYKIASIAIPIAASANARSLLVTIEHIMIPISLQKFGASYSESISVYGIIHGVVFSLLLFPAAIIGAFSSLLVSDVSELMAKNNMPAVKKTKHCISNLNINYIIARISGVTLLFAICVSFCFVFFSDEILKCIGGYNPNSSFYLKLLAPLVPVMYMDNITDGFLKGLNEQISSMRYNIIDSSLCLLLVIFLVPKTGIAGYIFVLYISEIINFTLSSHRLYYVCDYKLNFIKLIIKPVFCAAASGTVTNILSDCFINNNPFLNILLYASVFLLLSVLTKAIESDEIKWFKNVLKLKKD